MTDTELDLQVYHVNGAMELERDHDTIGTFETSKDAQTFAIEYCDRHYGARNYVLNLLPKNNPNGTIALLAIATPIEVNPPLFKRTTLTERS